MISDKTLVKMNKLSDIMAQIAELEAELEEMLGGEPVAKVKSDIAYKTKTGKKPRFCKLCDKPGHRRDSCDGYGKPPVEEENIEKVPGEKELVEDVKRLWVEEDKSSIETAHELRITLGKLNRIIMMYKLQKKI